jgi:subtilisin-like proprotein convertase family protein
MTTRRDNGWTLTAGALAAVAISALAVTAGGPIAPSAQAAAPGIAATCGSAVVTKDATVNASLEPTATPDDGNPATPRTYVAGPPRTSIITVTGAQPYLRDLDLRTLIKHEASKDVTITLTAPGGKVIVINSGNEPDTFAPPATGSYRNGGPNDDMWNGTRWDDQGGEPVNDFPFLPANEGTPVASIEPEGSLGSLTGINPNGNWTLTVQNSIPHYATSSGAPPVEAPDRGTFISWGLDISTLPAAPVVTPLSAASTVAVPIPDNAPAGISQTLAIAGAPAGQTIQDVDLITKVPHNNIADLEITLISPAGTQVSIATDPGRGEGDYANTFNPTRWDDAATDGVTDVGFTTGVNKVTLQPEEALAAFNGENPNGNWTLKVVDDGVEDLGMLESARLEIKTADCFGGAAAVAPPPPPPPPVAVQALKVGLIGSAKRSVKFKAKLATVKVTLTREAKITAVLVRGKKKIKSLTKAGVAGTNTVRVRLPKRPGKYILKVSAVATDGATSAKVITITKKRRG